MKTRAALRGSGGTAFSGSTAITNLLPAAGQADLNNGVWTCDADTTVAGQIIWDGAGTERCRDQWWTPGAAGNKLLFLFRCRAAGVNDNAAVYYSRTGIRYYDQVGSGFVDETRFASDTYTPRIRNDGVMRNYNAQFLAQTGGANIMFDLLDHNDNDAGIVIEYENVGLYDIEGLTGWVHDANYPQVRFNLDQRLTWWGDSTGNKMVYDLGNLLNVIHNNDEAEGGDTMAEILVRFDAEIASGGEKLNHPTIILVGHNTVTSDDANGTEIKAGISYMTAKFDALGTDYRVVTLLAAEEWTTTPTTDAGTTLSAINSWINSTYTTKAIDLFAYLQTKGDGSANDIADVAAGLIPGSLRTDASVHLNGRGKDFMLDKVLESVDIKGWHG